MSIGRPPAPQQVLDLAPIEEPAFANFLPGRNAEAIAGLCALASGAGAETIVYVWGGPAAGKTHLLQATVAFAAARGADAAYIDDPQALVPVTVASHRERGLVAIDAIERAGATAQAAMFTLFNTLAAAGAHLVVAARVPPAALAFRDDLRTRLGSGLTFEVHALDDAEKPAALRAFARARGLELRDELIDWLLAHARRDLPTLRNLIVALDRHSLATRRALTIPLLRELFERPGSQRE